MLRSFDPFFGVSFETHCADNVDIKIKEDYIRYMASDKNNITVNFNLDPYKINEIRPNFISLVMKFIDKIDLYKFLNFNEESKFKCELISFTNSLTNVDIEFKTSDSNRIIKAYRNAIVYGSNRIEIALNEMKSEALRQISEICFVIHPHDIVEVEGMFEIINLRVQA